MTRLAEPPRVLRSTVGRVRIRAAGAAGTEEVERALLETRGVIEASASRHTGNVLVRYDAAITDESSIVSAVASVAPERDAEHGSGELARDDRDDPPPLSEAERRPEVARPRRRARIAVAGLERDPGVGRRAVRFLEGRAGVARVVPSPLTGRVLVELAADAEGIDFDRLADELR